jgi:hypothetical protein
VLGRETFLGQGFVVPSAGMNAGAEQRLAGVDVAQAAQHRLVQQHRFEDAATPAQPPGEIVQRDREGIRAQAGHPLRQRVAQFDAPELPGIIEQQAAEREEEQGTGVGARRGGRGTAHR